MSTNQDEFQVLLENIRNILGADETYDEMKLGLPQLGRSGKKIIWTNFMDTCKRLNRDKASVMKYFSSELGTDVFLNGTEELTFKGKYNQNDITKILKNYVNQQIKCKSCSSTATMETKEGRFTKLLCSKCKSCVTIS